MGSYIMYEWKLLYQAYFLEGTLSTAIPLTNRIIYGDWIDPNTFWSEGFENAETLCVLRWALIS